MNYLPPLPVAIPFTAAAFLMAGSALLSRRVRDLATIAASVSVVVICSILLSRSAQGPIVYWFGGWEPRAGVALGISFAIDTLGAGLALLSALLVTAALVFSWRYFEEVGPLYSTLMLIFLGAMEGFCLTGDLFNLFVFFELMSVAAYSLTAYKIEEEPAVMGAFNFAVTNSIGAFLVLTGIGLLYGRTGALNMAQLGAALAGQQADWLVVSAFTLMTCGFAVKAAVVPFHFWLADAHAVAPTPVCALFSGVMVELGLFAMARIYWSIFSDTIGPASGVRAIWLAVGASTAVMAGIMCIAERHLKRMLAFSTISHTGVFLVGVALLTPHGLAGSALYIVGHGLVKAALFLAAGIVLNRFGSVDENFLRGAGQRFRGLGLLFVVGGLALSGLPPFCHWFGKALIEESAAQLNLGGLSLILLISSALTGGAVLRAAGQIFWGLGPDHNQDALTPKKQDKETGENYNRPPAVMLIPPLALLAAALALGLFPALPDEGIRAAMQFENRQVYAAAVLAGQNGPGGTATASGQHFHSSTWSGVVATAGAVGVALLALFPNFIPARIRKICFATQKPIMAVLRGLHSGLIADYIVWIVVGTAVIGGCLVFRLNN